MAFTAANWGNDGLRLRTVLLFIVALVIGVNALGGSVESVSKASRIARLRSMQQLAFTASRAEVLSVLPGYGNGSERGARPRAWQRRIPNLCSVAELSGIGLQGRSVPLPQADTLFDVNYPNGRLGRVREPNGRVRLINPEIILAKFVNNSQVVALRVEAGRELEAVKTLLERPDVVFAELDMVETRASVSNDPFIANQWHHETIHTSAAWNFGTAQSPVRVAIVDYPFQMNHPDLVANTAPGWDVVTGQPVVASTGIEHSTLAAGLIAATPNNGLGVAGVGNCIVLPININPTISDLCNAVYWAATNNVRVVNISWTGAESDALNEAAHFFKTKARGLVIMAGGNDLQQLDVPNQPDIWCVSMTDEADNQRSTHGNLIDFAAPGWGIFSTTTNGGYAFDSGTSFSTPIVAGICARLFSINPSLSPDDVIDILKSTAVDLGEPGWDMWFGWGRVDFGAAAAVAASRTPGITIASRSSKEITFATQALPDCTCELWKTDAIGSGLWSRVEDATIQTNGTQLTFTVSASSMGVEFFKVLFQPK